MCVLFMNLNENLNNIINLNYFYIVYKVIDVYS